MKRNSKFFCGLFTLIALVSLSSGCDNDIYDQHYLEKDVDLNMDINTLIASDADLSVFKGLLQETGYDSVISNSQSYTVWAPTDAALENLSQEIKNDPELLEAFVSNHISLFSFTSGDAAKEDLLIKMMNGKYIQFTNEGESKFAGVSVTEGDFLTNNGILHKLSSYVEVKSNIWGYLNENAPHFQILMDYLEPFNTLVFDESLSTAIGTNSLGGTVYDSVFVESNSYFDIVGNLNSEEERSSFVGLTDEVYNEAFDSIRTYYVHPDSSVVDLNVKSQIFENLNFTELSDYAEGMAVNTQGKVVSLPLSAIQEDVPLSNGNLMVLNEFTFTPEELFNTPIRYEVENSERRTVGDFTYFAITKGYDLSASGQFINKVELLTSPEKGVNDFFSVAFSNVLTTDYDVFVKFAPVGDLLATKLKFDLSYTRADLTVVTISKDTLISNLEENRIQIGKTFSNPVFVDADKNNAYITKLSISIDVSDAELVLYDRIVGIDYVELVPVK